MIHLKNIFSSSDNCNFKNILHIFQNISLHLSFVWIKIIILKMCIVLNNNIFLFLNLSTQLENAERYKKDDWGNIKKTRLCIRLKHVTQAIITEHRHLTNHSVNKLRRLSVVSVSQFGSIGFNKTTTSGRNLY